MRTSDLELVKMLEFENLTAPKMRCHYRIMMKSAFFLVLLLASPSAHATEINCTWQPKPGEPKETLTLEALDKYDRIVRMQFAGSAPYRYFAHTKKGPELVEFATRKGSYGLFNLKVLKSSRLSITHNEGGNLYSWFDGTKQHVLTCKH